MPGKKKKKKTVICTTSAVILPFIVFILLYCKNGLYDFIKKGFVFCLKGFVSLDECCILGDENTLSVWLGDENKVLDDIVLLLVLGVGNTSVSWRVSILS